MTPDEMVAAAIAVAEEGLAAGELPIGAVVVMGDEVVGRAFTQDAALERRLVHADLLAMIQADERLGWTQRPEPLSLAVNLEPCFMCLGAAMALGVANVYFGLESPGDGATRIAATWEAGSTDMPWYRAPAVVGGIRRGQVADQFRRYCDVAADTGFRRWAQTLAGRGYRDRSVTLQIREGFVTDEFVALSRTPGRSAEQEAHLAVLKQEMADRLLGAPPEDVDDVDEG